MSLINKSSFRSCTERKGYEWTRNSCYLDTVLWVLFSSPMSFTSKMLFSPMPHMISFCTTENMNEEMFLEFQQAFRKIAYYFRCGVGDANCSGFRQLYRKWHSECPQLHTRFHSSEQQEAQEFLQFILSLYGMNGQERSGAVSQEEFYYGVSHIPRSDTTWKFIRRRKDKTQSIVWNIPYHTLRHTKSPQRTLQNFLSRQDEIWNVSTQYKNCEFNAIRTIHSLTKFANLLVISVERTHPVQQKVSHFRLHLSPTLTDTKGKTLTLFGIICHEGKTAHSGHYTAFHLSTKDHEWYYYDDMNLPIQKIGSWESLLSIRHVSTHSVLFLYSYL